MWSFLARLRIPSVVLWSTGIFASLLVTTIVVWIFEIRWTRAEEPALHLYEVLVDGLKVGLGALIGVMSQWAGRSFAPRQAPAVQAREVQVVQTTTP